MDVKEGGRGWGIRSKRPGDVKLGIYALVGLYRISHSLTVRPRSIRHQLVRKYGTRTVSDDKR